MLTLAVAKNLAGPEVVAAEDFLVMVDIAVSIAFAV